MIHIEYFTFNGFQERCSVVWDDEKICVVIDPGCESSAELSELTDFMNNKGLKPVCIMLTHGHLDHVYGVAGLSDFYGGLPVYMHPSDKATLAGNGNFSRMFGTPDMNPFQTIDIAEGNIVEVGSLRFEVLETPGHTPGGVCYLEKEEKVIFSGDTLFAGCIGRTDLPGGDYDSLMKSIFEKLMVLTGDVTVIPGHGPVTSIAEEGMKNPFLLPFNEPYEE